MLINKKEDFLIENESIDKKLKNFKLELEQ